MACAPPCPPTVHSAQQVCGTATWQGAAQTSILAAPGPPSTSRPHTWDNVSPPWAVASLPVLPENCLADAGHLPAWACSLSPVVPQELREVGFLIGNSSGVPRGKGQLGWSGVVQDACQGCPSKAGRSWVGEEGGPRAQVTDQPAPPDPSPGDSVSTVSGTEGALGRVPGCDP